MRTNEQQRRGADIASDLQALSGPPQPRRSLPSVPVVGGVPVRRGRGYWSGTPPTPSGGIASPLTEKTKVVDGQTVPDRDYWPEGLLSSDGLFTMPAIKVLNLTDANGADVQIQLANPVVT